MRFRSILLLALPALATACEPALEAGPRVQFVGDSRLTTTARRLTTPADTITTRIYAQADDSPLERVRITVNYDPVPEATIFNPLAERPKADLVYLDSTRFSLDSLSFQSTQPTRSTAGHETWRYEVFDAQGRKGTRSLFLYLFRADSATAVYHSYTTTLTYTVAPATKATATTAATEATNTGRRFLALREGLALPGFSVRNQPDNQKRIDLIYQFDNAVNAPTLSLPTSEALKLNWAKGEVTEIRSTALDSTAFQRTDTPDLLRTAFSNGAAFAFQSGKSTGPLRRGQVLAFLTPGGNAGLLRVQRIGTTNARQLVVQVRVAK